MQIKAHVDDRHLAFLNLWTRLPSKTIRGFDAITAVLLKVEENQLVGVFGEIGVVVDGLKGA
jgi:hypothetical protein